ncbi:MAG: hypothetical protein MZV70_37390 [Desulfobacterales bacterium]|nr:hypothetical protein [Desulfobacterales bacterium]
MNIALPAPTIVNFRMIGDPTPARCGCQGNSSSGRGQGAPRVYTRRRWIRDSSSTPSSGPARGAWRSTWWARLDNGETFAVVERRARPFLAVREADFPAVRTARRPGGRRRLGDELAAHHHGRRPDPPRRGGHADPPARPARRSPPGRRPHLRGGREALDPAPGRRGHPRRRRDRRRPWRRGRRVARVYEDPAIVPAADAPEPRLSVLSLDIETDRIGRAVWAVGLAFTRPRRHGERRGAPERRRRAVGALLPLREGPAARAARAASWTWIPTS